MAVFSKFGTGTLLIAASICFATAAAIVYILTKEETLYEEWDREPFYSSRHSVIEVAVPSDMVGVIIGRSGSNIKRIQEATNTTINFRNKSEDARIAVIHGKPLDTQTAESLLRNEIAELLKVITVDVAIPSNACGVIIGTNGNTIRMISDVSKAKVSIERCYDRGTSSTNRRVTIKGTESQIEMAKAMIEETLAKADICEGNAQLSVTSHDHEEASGSSQGRRTEKLVAIAQDGFIEVFVSVVDSPNRFWVQKIGVKAKELDKLISDMSDYYGEGTNASGHKILEKVDVGTLVAAPFQFDDCWYRAVVTAFEEDEYDPSESSVGISYVDFGGTAMVKRKEICSLRSEFDRLPFQAIECSLHTVEPKGGGDRWTEESISLFERLTYNSQWKAIMVKVLSGQDDKVKRVQMVDTSGPANVIVAEAMVASGVAQWIQSEQTES